MKLSELFKGRFGNFYLYRIWIFIVVCGAILYSLIDFILYSSTLDSHIFTFILLIIIYGIVLCIPSLIFTEILYKFLSKKKLSSQIVFLLVLIISLITTNLTYYLFWSNGLGKVPSEFYYFALIYNICLIIGFFIFHKKPETLNFKPETK